MEDSSALVMLMRDEEVGVEGERGRGRGRGRGRRESVG